MLKEGNSGCSVMLNERMLGSGVWMAALVCGIGFIFLAKIILPLSEKFLREHGMMAVNYRGWTVCNGLGLYLWFLQIMYVFLLSLGEPVLRAMGGNEWTTDNGIGYGNRQSDLFAYGESTLLTQYSLALTFVFICGWLDDTVGDKTVKGLNGHWRKWKNERTITTGLLKAFGIGIASLWLAAQTTKLFSLFALTLLKDASLYETLPLVLRAALQTALKAALMLLSANAFNLLDLRPGRAIKVFFSVVLMLLAAGSFADSVFLLFPMIVGLVFLFPGDLRGRWMLGDTGANLIGFAWGAALVLSTPLWMQTGVLGLLLWIHVYAEKRSLSQSIENRPVLRWLDRLGRI